jgi:hypothetical protein
VKDFFPNLNQKYLLMMLKVLHKELIDHDKVMNEYDQQIHIYLIEIKIENLHWIPMIVNEQELIPKIKISIG